MPEPITVSVRQAIALTGLSEATLYRMIRRSEIETSTVGRRRLLSMASLKKRIGAE